ncbi:MAG: hypothetical protein QOD71_3187 [Thermoleophilaceae bacterium]|jgi:hypothetical protein|nr:hypothetical protein [Thermoleophilaceae bacterium]
MRSIRFVVPWYFVAPVVGVVIAVVVMRRLGVPQIVYSVFAVAWFLWQVVTFVVLLPAIGRVVRERRRLGAPRDVDQADWSERRRSLLAAFPKLLTAWALIVGLVALVDAGLDTHNAGDHAVRLELPQNERWATLLVKAPHAGGCASKTRVEINHSSRSSLRMTDREGDKIKPLTERPYRAVFRIPMTWERNKVSCYYQVPDVWIRHGSARVRLYVRASASASDSVPPPTEANRTYWGWRCQAVRDGDGCKIMAVIDADPDMLGIGFNLVVAGSMLTIALTLLGNVGIGVFRGWRSDFRAIWGIGRATSSAPPPTESRVSPSTQRPRRSHRWAIGMGVVLALGIWRRLSR